MIINALGISATTFVGQNYGAGRTGPGPQGHGGLYGNRSLSFPLHRRNSLWRRPFPVEIFTSDENVRSDQYGSDPFHESDLYHLYRHRGAVGNVKRRGGYPPSADDNRRGNLSGAGAVDSFVLPLRPDILNAAFSYPLTWSLTSVALSCITTASAPEAVGCEALDPQAVF